MRRRPALLLCAPLLLLCAAASDAGLGGAALAAPSRRATPAVYDVRAFGAAPDGKSKSTDAIRKAIAAAAANGGGTVLFAGGVFLTGPIHLKSNITLHVDAGAVVRFSSDFDDYLPMVRMRWEGTEVVNFSPLIYGDNVDNVAITGRGLIDGGGEPWWDMFRKLKAEHKRTGAFPHDSKWQKEFARLNTDRADWPDDRRMLEVGFLRPPLIQILNCRNLSISDLTLKNPPFWTINPVYCDGVTVRGVTIDNPDDSPNTDGINPESSRNVHISDSHINSGDDCITIKSGRDRQGRRIGRPSENVTITNCTMLHGHGGVAIGSEMSGGVRRVAISNCVFQGTDRGIRIKSTRGRGGAVEDVRVSNIVMRDIKQEAITLNSFYTDVPVEPVSERTPRFRNIRISGVTAHADQAGTLLGLEEARLDDVTLTDIDIVANTGFVIKNANHVTLRSVRIHTATGPAIITERSNDVRLFDVGTLAPHAGTPAVEMINVKHAFVQGCFAPPGSEGFLSVRGRDTQSIIIGENDLADARAPVVIGKDVDPRAVQTRR
jgi:polygalacturonase